MLRKPLVALAACAALLCAGAARAQDDCAPPAVAASADPKANMFSPEQETVFGELAVQNLAGEMRFVRAERLTAYLESIGERIARHLPPTGLKFRFYLVDIPEANAFNLPGGHVLVSRKLVAFADNEDELAGVVAHELGHAVVRHAAVDTSEALRKILGVNSLGDRRDVTEKYNLLIERARTRPFSRPRGHEDGQQLEADRIGLFAMAAAGYDPSAFYTAFGRLTEAKGKGGGWLSNFFGGRPAPVEKRIHEMVRAVEKLPAACRERAGARPTEEFLKWQADVVSFREAGRKEELPGLLWKRELQPKLRSDVSHFAFSPDGRLLLAQDDYSVTVISRDPPRVLFQIPAEGADEAQFTPDGRHVVFTTENLRYEKWSVEEAAPVEVRELVLRRDCFEHALSPDGSRLACVDLSMNASVVDTKTGKKVWEKRQFYRLDVFEYLAWVGFRGRGGDDERPDFFRIRFSPDSRYVVFSRSEKYRFSFRWDALTVAASENTAVALDLTTMKPVDVGGDIKKLAARAYVFLDPGSVLGTPSGEVGESGVFAFPSGKRLRKFDFGGKLVKRTANPDLVIVKPLADSRTGIFDVSKGALVGALQKEDVTAWGDVLAYEATDGKVLLRETAYNEAEKRLDFKSTATVEIPVGPVSGLVVSAVSDDFGWLLLSSKTRGGMWRLPTGERRLYVRGFKGGVAANDGGALGDFPRQGDAPHGVVLMNAGAKEARLFRELPERGARQHGRFVLVRSGLKGKADKPTPGALLTGRADAEDYGLTREVRFELKDAVSDKVIWSRDFPKEVPEYSFDEHSGRLIFFWRLGGEAGRERLRESAELTAKADALGNRADDYFVEVVDASAQKTVGTMMLETGQGSFDVGRGLSEGDWLVLRDSGRRVLIYSLKTGELRHRFFGETAAVNPRRNQVAVENFPGEVAVYDLDTGDLRASLRVNGSAAFVRFNVEGNRLFVLSDAQAAYAFDLDRMASAAAQPAQAAK